MIVVLYTIFITIPIVNFEQVLMKAGYNGMITTALMTTNLMEYYQKAYTTKIL